MNKFLVLYCMPHDGMQDWMQKPEAERKAAEDKMKADWDTWMAAHGSTFTETCGAGKTTEVSTSGAKETHNDIMLYSIANAESQEALAALMHDHPHLGIPGATIQIMPANPVPMK